ncbi:hypothetical protein PHLGIDRAFT_109427 [Phlebiopsis gigantea 11061_1 CR5-6]|uniref:DUF6535 domain-containing protein n=1 Tax=Phlebiopsis gigantea (strain 11061_1 CR5-6) TaxID=745531 RepID=A0A0C3RU79_PHLG1|nr:hypothetical protein PHLGIDRAFT_109427 [Phlebiopsis gigantea 11061_1 CR5-6]
MEKRSAEHLSLPSLRLSAVTSERERHIAHDDGWEEIQEDVIAKRNVQSPITDSPQAVRVQQKDHAPSRVSKRSGSGMKQSRRKIAREPPQRSIHRSRTYHEPGDDRSERASLREKPKTTSDAWSKCNRVLKDHDAPMVAGWKEDIDTLLVFAGLFSAVLTAFIVESYTFLQPDPEGTSTNILREILVELRNTSSPQAAASVRSQFPFITPVTPSFAIRVNTMWFCSLVFSLSAASVGILVKQWLRDYSSRAGTSSREGARIRQFRHNGLVKWHVPEIIAALPLLLQWALGLFFIGLIDLLWSLNFIVAGIVTGFACTSLAFLAVTTILPTLWADCPHRSPQALAFYLIYKASARMGKWRRFKLWLVKLLHERKHSNWREREKHIVRTQEASNLDRQILADADALFMDDEILENVIKPCIEETTPAAAAECLLDILAHRADGMIDDLPSWKPSGFLESSVTTQLRLTVDILRRSIPSSDQERLMRMLRMLDRLCRAMPFELDHPDAKELYEQVYELVSALLSFNEDVVRRSAFSLLYTLFPRANASVRINAIGTSSPSVPW